MENQGRQHSRDWSGARHDSYGRNRANCSRGRRPRPYGIEFPLTGVDDSGYSHYRARALSDHYTQTQPRYSRQFANRRALELDSQSARLSEKEKRKERALSFSHDRLGRRARDGKPPALPSAYPR